MATKGSEKELGKWSKFEWAVLALTVVVLLVMVGRFLAGGLPSGEPWRVEVQRNDAPGLSVSEEGPPPGLLEGETIDLNTASQADLERLPGIGPSRARDIITERQENGPFRTVDELTRVKGIGKSILEELRPYARVE